MRPSELNGGRGHGALCRQLAELDAAASAAESEMASHLDSDGEASRQSMTRLMRRKVCADAEAMVRLMINLHRSIGLQSGTDFASEEAESSWHHGGLQSQSAIRGARRVLSRLHVAMDDLSWREFCEEVQELFHRVSHCAGELRRLVLHAAQVERRIG